MKRIIPIILFSGIILFFSTAGQAQILDRLGKKMEQKAKARLDQKIDRAMDKTLDKTEEKIDGSVKKKDDGDDSTNNSSSNSESSNENMFAAFGSANIEDVYSFDYKIKFNIVSISEKETTTMNMEMSLPREGNYVIANMSGISQNGKPLDENAASAMEGSTMIMDYNNNSMVIINEEQKSYMAMKMPNEGKEEKLEQVDFTITKTGNTKTILGFSCDEYSVKSTEQTGLVWITTDSRLKGIHPFKEANSKNVVYANLYDHMQGFMMEMNMELSDVKKKKDVKEMTLKVISFDEISDKINMSEYNSGY